MSLRERTPGVIEPCLPSPAKAAPSGLGWIHEIKHDGFRIMARRDGAGVRLITHHGNDFTARFHPDAGRSLDRSLTVVAYFVVPKEIEHRRTSQLKP